MTRHQSLPQIWLISDARNDAVMVAALRALPRGSGLIFRHYHLPPPERRARFAVLARQARAQGHRVILAGSMAQARRWGADGAYGPISLIGPGARGLRLATAHSLHALGRVRRAQAVLLSPAFPTRSHPGAKGLGPVRFRTLAARSPSLVIALGGMSPARARCLNWPRWAAIDAFLR